MSKILFKVVTIEKPGCTVLVIYSADTPIVSSWFFYETDDIEYESVRAFFALAQYAAHRYSKLMDSSKFGYWKTVISATGLLGVFAVAQMVGLFVAMASLCVGLIVVWNVLCAERGAAYCAREDRSYLLSIEREIRNYERVKDFKGALAFARSLPQQGIS